MVGSKTILVVDDEKSLRDTLEILLHGHHYHVLTASSAEAALPLLEQHVIDLILTDMKMTGLSGVDLLRQIKQIDQRIEVIVLTAYASTSDAVEAMKLGAYDYLTKPYNLDELLVLVERALEKRQLHLENQNMRQQLKQQLQGSGLIATSTKMQAILDMIGRVASVNTTILITGESGVGKEVIAKTIHQKSPRHKGAFIAINCGALPEHLIEAELFGYERGAFTGADQAKPGLLEQASEGTLFLDEIGELPLTAQVKLLRVLQEQSVRRLGGKKEIKLDVRYIAATNRALLEKIAEGSFRQDLFYRLNVIEIVVPPLRERTEDIVPLTYHFIEQASKKMGLNVKQPEKDVLDMLKRYHFPGNIRELHNLIERAVILSTDGTLKTTAFPPEVQAAGKNITTISSAGHISPSPALLSQQSNLEQSVEAFEKQMFVTALEKSKGIKTQAAKLLGLSFRQFRYKAKKFGL